MRIEFTESEYVELVEAAKDALDLIVETHGSAGTVARRLSRALDDKLYPAALGGGVMRPEPHFCVRHDEEE